MTWQTKDILDLCEGATEKIMPYYRQGVSVTVKEDNTPVTQADLASDAYLRAGLRRLEDIPILSEETEDDLSRLQAKRIWLVDPLDGTKDFIAHTDQFAINIALIEEGRPIFGAIYMPVLKEFYYAYKDQGAYSLIHQVTKRLHVSERKDHLRVVKSNFNTSQRAQEAFDTHADKIASISSVGSCYKGCVIARGDAEIYLRYGLTSEWDTAPMDLLVHEAGGLFRALDGELMTYNRIDTLNRLGFYVLNHPDNLIHTP